MCPFRWFLILCTLAVGMGYGLYLYFDAQNDEAQWEKHRVVQEDRKKRFWESLTFAGDLGLSPKRLEGKGPLAYALYYAFIAFVFFLHVELFTGFYFCKHLNTTVNNYISSMSI
eukprot:Clim_evm5s251 gene=Clim_evmTU5s251